MKAVKRAEILKPYDNSFVYAEVNADKVYWRYFGPENPLKLIRKDEAGIGLFISTKAVGNWLRQDITSSYKYEEKTEEERATMLKALKQANSAFSRYYLNEEFNEVQFELELKDDVKVGEDFNVSFFIVNKSSEKEFIINGNLAISTLLYTGKNRKDLKSLKFSESILPQSSVSVDMPVTFQEYFEKLMDQSIFNVSCM